MYIHIPSTNKICDETTRSQLVAFINQPEPGEQPPCPGCDLMAPNNCSPFCQQAPKALSVEPDLYPLEDKIVPLVYEMMATRLIRTCWSCQGHEDSVRQLWKVPQVCFHVDAMIYTKLVTLHLNRLYFEKQLHYGWHIVLTDFGNSLGNTYSLQADLSLTNHPNLEFLQQDIWKISEKMHVKLKDIARELLQNYCR